MALATYRLQDGVIVGPRLGVGAVEAAPCRIAAAEAVLAGQKPTAALFEAAASAAVRDVDPLDQDVELAAYKRDVVHAVVKRALTMAEGTHE
jgi:CO/xanthine dehydrogenase FAD-binding subunit